RTLMDHNIFFAINGLAGKSGFIDNIGIFFGGDYFLFVFLGIVIGLWFRIQFRNRVYLALGSVIVGRIIITEGLKRIISRARPYEILNVHQLLADNDVGVSFPSGHATIYFALAFSFWGTKYFWPFLVLAVLGSLGRVFVGVHFPLDIFAGAVIGSVTSLVLLKLFKTRILS
ncbi:MAG: phosphatase PAP2 family protein, partial [Candidatus Doudnabacteria bacterium]|nr:phosphatase PAP2 family protein [Candidatus Doudnabacteria bacterium]